MLRSIESKDHMTIAPVTLRPETGIFEAIDLLLARHISGATVLDAEGRVVGVISEMDCLRAILSGTYHGEVGGTVADIMTTKVETVEQGASVVDVAQRLIAGNRRRFPVVKDGKFVGQVSCRSILRAVIEYARSRRPNEH
jgi:CBS domain-containing protein